MVSNLVSNNRLGACAKGYTGIVYTSLTQDWYYEVRQVAVSDCIDGFVWEQWAAAGCMSIADPDVVTTRPSLHACYPRILLMLDQSATVWATGGVYVIYTWPLPVMRAVSMVTSYTSISG